VQTPQREWLRGPLRPWVEDCVNAALDAFGGVWLDRRATRTALANYFAGQDDNSFFVWQWVSLALLLMQEAAISI
jgi:asparagine synthase (glutamine-hydrolysing)